MIINFQEQTQRLSWDEKRARHFITEKLKNSIGRKNVVSAEKLASELKAERGLNMSGSRMRKVINSIRLKDMVPCLIATSRGYYVSADKEELSNYIYSLRQRCAAISMLADVIEIQQVKNKALVCRLSAAEKITVIQPKQREWKKR